MFFKIKDMYRYISYVLWPMCIYVSLNGHKQTCIKYVENDSRIYT